MNTRQKLAYLPLILVTLFTIAITLLVPTSLGFFQGSDGTPTAPGFTIEPISLLIGVGIGGLALGIPLLARSKHTKTGHVTLLKRTADVEQAVGKSPPATGGSEVPGGTETKHTKSGHVTLLKRTEDAASTSAGRKILDYGETGDNATPPEESDAIPGNPIKGLSIKGGQPHTPLTATDKVAGNPIGGLHIKSDKPRPD